MTASERAAALLYGKPVDCPQCGVFPMREEPDVDLGPFFGGVTQGGLACPACGLHLSKAMAGVVGLPGDDTAAIHLLAGEGATGSERAGPWDAKR